MSDLANLGEQGFKDLGNHNSLPGFNRITQKIGSDYTRAEDRRLNILVAMTLLEIRQKLIISGKHYDNLKVPYPFCNLLSESDVYKLSRKFTNDIEINFDEEGYIVLLRDVEEQKVAAPRIEKIDFRIIKRKVGGRGTKRVDATHSHSALGLRVIDSSIGLHAEDYLENSKLNKLYGKELIRIGHTNLETTVLSDGNVPGADFIVGKLDKPLQFIEVKSTKTFPPKSIRLTASELSRAKVVPSTGNTI